MKLLKLFSILLLLPITFLFAQDESESDVEEVVVVGSQIKGAKITGALPVTVITADDIESLAIESGEELFADLAENGGNNFNQTDFSGGYNASRGDVGSLDLRNIGTGNTVTLLNGRRLVQSPGYATEWVGGSYVPVSSVNSNLIPVYGAERVEILRDGASAIYGADAVAGVINTVLKDDFDGLTMRVRQNWYDGFDAKDNKVSIQWGKTMSDGSNLSVYFDRYDRERIRGIEDPKWAAGDLRGFLPSPDSDDPRGAFNDTTWRNMSTSSVWAQFYEGSNIFTIFEPNDSNCTSNSSSNLYNIPGLDHMCLYDSSSIRDYARLAYGTTYDKRGPLLRNNLVMFYNTTLDNGVEAYSELSYYKSDSSKQLYGGAPLGMGSSAKNGGNTQPILVPSTNYWLNQLQRPNGDLFVDKEGDELWFRRFRFSTPRSWDSTRETWRVVQGFRGEWNNWDWDSGIVVSKATSEMDNHGRQSMTLLNAALADSTPNAYNPFCAGVGCNEEAFTVSIFRNNTTELFSADLKMTNDSVFSMPAGDVGMLVGAEVRKETMDDARDPRINGTIVYSTPPQAANQATFPYISDIVNSSPSPNTYGERVVTSLFTELQIPLANNLDSQLAVRAENSDDYGSNVVGKFALGWEPTSWGKLRASTSTSFRAPNLITVNEGLVVRNNSQEDALLTAALGEEYDSAYSIQRVAQGNEDLEAEEATNSSVGFVLTPGDNLVVTVDKWEIATENTIGLFGERNHILLDTLIRSRGGANECVGNPNVIRGDFIEDNDPESDTYNANWDPNLCKAGNVIRVNDTYLNLDNRTLKGTDYAIEYSVDTDAGSFSAKFMRVQFDEFLQEASGPMAELVAASGAGGPLEGLISASGFGDLLGTFDKRAYPEVKDSVRLAWKHKRFDAYLSGTKVGSFEELGVTNNAKRSDGTYACSGTTSYSGGTCGQYWTVESMLTLNLTLGYKFKNGLRVRGQIRNLEDQRAPLADEYTWGFVGDVHSDYGRSYSLEFYQKF
jgi:iron complex outermembrane receptor protein